MKLSKESLHEILFEASMSIYDNAYKAGIALENDTLEIEGYERVQWTKFDPDDSKTTLEKFERVLFSMDGVIMCGTTQDMLTAKWRGAEQIYWHPTPKPPVETEAQNEAE